MKTLVRAMGCLVLATFSAAALEKDFVDQILESARNVEREAADVSLALKKKADTEDVKKKIEAMNDDLVKLQELVATFEASHPTMSERDRADWETIKSRVQLLGIFHNEKKKLADEGLNKNRGLIRAHADGLVKRAQNLQAAAVRVQRAPMS